MEEAQRFSANFVRRPACESPSKITRLLAQLLAIRNLIANGVHIYLELLAMMLRGNLESVPYVQ
jgi:hypothetical protein